MAFTTSTGTDWLDVFADWRTFLVTTLGWTENEYTAATAAEEEVATVPITVAGTGYVVDEVLTLVGGTSTVAATFTVTTIDGSGGVTGLSITTAGNYTVTPSNPAATTSSASGINCTLSPTWQHRTATLSVEAPGDGPTQRVFLNFNTTFDVGNNFYTWRPYGATSYDSALSFPSQTNATPEVHLLLTDAALEYWFYGNTRRAIAIVRSGSNYMSMYCGFFLPFSLPSEHAFPMYVGASYPSAALPGVANSRNSSIADPGVGTANYMRRSALAYRELENQASSASAISPSTGQRAFIWPAKTSNSHTASSGTITLWNNGGFESIKNNANDESPIAQCTIMDTVEGAPIGALEGVFSTSGFGRSAEQTLTRGGRTFRLFQRAFRTNPGDFFAVEEL